MSSEFEVKIREVQAGRANRLGYIDAAGAAMPTRTHTGAGASFAVRPCDLGSQTGGGG